MGNLAIEDFSAVLRRRRAAAGLSQEELAERSGLSVRGISDLERGRRAAPHLTTVRLLADALELGAAERAELLAAARPEYAGLPQTSLPRLSPLPIPPSSLFGRETVLAEGCRALRRPEVRLLTLTGPGGVGKTRLAIAMAQELGHDFPTGIAFVDLAPIRDHEVVATSVTSALGLRDEGRQVLAERLRVFIADHPLLLVLDNFEHLIEAASLVANLVATCQHLKILVTSRMPLRLSAEHLLPIAPLPSPVGSEHPDDLSRNPAVSLFMERAHAVRPDLALDETNAAAVAGIVRRLDGLPLAIELAAARVRLLSPQALLARLAPRLAMLENGHRDAPDRQQTMRGAIAWSYDLLPPAEQVLFRRLAVFDGGIGLDAAAAIVPAGSIVADLERSLESLVEQSLLQAQIHPAGDLRLVMLETIRDYANEQLVANGEEASVRAAHAAYFMAMADRHDRAGWVQHDPSLPLHFEAELPNLRAALSWLDNHDDAEGVQRMAGALRWFWSARGHVPEGRMWLASGLRHATPTAPAVRGRAVMALAQYVYFQGNEPLARTLFTEGLALYRSVGDQLGQAFALSALSALALYRKDFAAAFALQEQALALTDGASDPEVAASMAASTISNMGGTAYAQGDLVRAADLADQALERYKKLGYIRGIIGSLRLSGNIERDRGNYALALHRCQESLSLAHIYDDQLQILMVLESIAWIAARRHLLEPAARLLAAAATLRERTGYHVQDPTEPDSPESVALAVRAELGAPQFDKEWAAGSVLPLNAAIVEARAIELPDAAVFLD